MGMIEIEIAQVIASAIKDPIKMKPLLHKMALIIDRQAMALKAMEWHKQSIDAAKNLDEELFNDIKKMRIDLNPTPENPQETKAP